MTEIISQKFNETQLSKKIAMNLEAVTANPFDKSVIQDALDTIYEFIDGQVNQNGNLEAREGVANCIALLLKKSFTSEDLCVKALTAVTLLCRHGEKKDSNNDLNDLNHTNKDNDNDMRKLLGGAGVCEVVVKTCGQYLSVPEVLKAGCLALRNLAIDNANEERLGFTNVCEFLITLLSTHRRNSDVVGAAFGALVNLARKCRSLAEATDPDWSEVIVEAFKDNVRMTSVAEAACWTIHNLCHVSSNMKCLIRHGACEAVLCALKIHGEALGLVEAACSVVVQISAVPIFSELLETLGIVHILITSLRTHSSPRAANVIVAVCNAVMNMSAASETFKTNMITLGGYLALENLLGIQPTLTESRPVIISALVSLLTIDDVVYNLQIALQKNSASSEIESALSAIIYILEDEAGRVRLEALNTFDLLVDCIVLLLKRSLSAEKTLCVKALVVVKLLCEQHSGEEDEDGNRSRSSDSSVLNEYNVRMLGDAGICEVVVKTCGRYLSVPEVLKVGCRVLQNVLVFVDDSRHRHKHKQDLVQHGAIAMLSSVLQHHGLDIEMCVVATHILQCLTEDRSHNENHNNTANDSRQYFVLSTSLIACVERHLHVSVVAEAASRTIGNIAGYWEPGNDCRYKQELDMLVLILETHVSLAISISHTLIEATLVAISRLTSVLPEFVFPELNYPRAFDIICTSLSLSLSLLTDSMDSEGIRTGCEALRTLSHKGLEMSSLGEVDVCQRMVDLCTLYPEESRVTLVACDVFASLHFSTWISDNNDYDEGLVHRVRCIIVKCLSVEATQCSSQLAMTVCQAVRSVFSVVQLNASTPATPTLYPETVGGGGGGKESAVSFAGVAKVLMTQIDHTDVVEACCWAIGDMAACADIVTGGIIMESLAACEVVVLALTRHLSSEGAAEAGCWALRNLSKTSERLYTAGICEVLTSVLSLYGHVSRISSLVLWAIGNLSQSVDCTARLRQAGACEVVVSWMRSHIEDCLVVEAGSWAVSQLACNEINAELLVAAGSCVVVCTALSACMSSTGAVEMCCLAIRSLAQYHTKELIDAGVCPVLISSLSMHTVNEPVTEAACSAICSLMMTTTTRITATTPGDGYELFSDVAYCQILVSLTVQHVSSPVVLKWIFLAIIDAVIISDIACQNFLESGALDAIIGGLTPHWTDPVLSNAAVRAFASLVKKAPPSCSFDTSTLRLFSSILMHHKSDATIVRGIFWMARHGLRVGDDLQDLGPAIVSALAPHLDAPDVVRAGLEAVVAVAKLDVVAAQHLGLLGVCEMVISSVKRHMTIVSVCTSGCQAIRYLSEPCEQSRSLFKSHLACDTIIIALDMYSDDTAVVQVALDALRYVIGDTVTDIQMDTVISLLDRHFLLPAVVEACCWVLTEMHTRINFPRRVKTIDSLGRGLDVHISLSRVIIAACSALSSYCAYIPKGIEECVGVLGVSLHAMRCHADDLFVVEATVRCIRLVSERQRGGGGGGGGAELLRSLLSVLITHVHAMSLTSLEDVCWLVHHSVSPQAWNDIDDDNDDVRSVVITAMLTVSDVNKCSDIFVAAFLDILEHSTGQNNGSYLHSKSTSMHIRDFMLSSMQIHQQNREIVMTIFRALLYVEDFTDTDVALVVVETIQSQMAFADVVETGCMFTRHLTRQDQKQSKQMKSKLAELGLLDTLLDMSQCHCSCPLLLEAACGAIANIYLDESGEEEEGLPRPTTAPWAPVFDASYTRSVVIITKIITMNMNHVSVLRESCRALAAMSPCFLFLSPQGQSQVWDALEGAVRTQMSDADLAVMGVIAVGNLSTHSSGECKRKGDVCGIVVSVLRSHITDLAVARVACVTLSTIFTSIAANEPTLVHMGISELLVAVLQLHVTDETLVYRAYRCISNLLSYHPETVTSLAAADVVEVLIPALASYTSSCGVTVAGGGAIAVLARHELMTARLALTNVTELLLLALSTHSAAPVVVQSILLALGNLFAMGKNFAESQELETSGVESILSIFSIHAHSESIIIAAFWTIRHIVTVKGVGVICGEHRSLEAMLSAWSNHHKGSVVVARAAYWTLAAVFLHSTITDRVATESGVYDTVLGSMQCFTSDQEAMHAGCWALANYLSSIKSLGSGLESESESHYLTSTASTSTFLHSTRVNMNESWELIASILEGHGSCPNTVEAACIAARNLYTSFASSTSTSSTPESFAPIVSSIGIAGSRNILSILATAVSQHISHPDTVKSVCDLLPILIIRMDNIQSPSDCGLLEAFSSLLSMYAASNPDIAAKALHALSALLTQYYDDNTSLSSSSSSSAVIALPKGLCRAVMNALQTNIGISNVTRPAYCVLQRLYKGGSRGRGRGDCCDRNSNMDCDSDYGSCDELIHNGILATLADVIGSSQSQRVMEEGDVDVGIEKAVLWFLGNVLQHLVNTELEERDCITVVELAVTALQHQHHSRGASSGVVRAACRVIRYVKIPHNADKQTFLDQLSCSRIIEAIHNNASDLDVAESGCWAIANLAASTNSQRDVVLAAGARECVSSVWTRHESVVEVAAIEMGLIVHCLTMHCTVLDVAQECCDFIRELLTSDARDNVSPDNGNDNIRLVLGEQGVCEALVSAVKSHVNDDRVVRSACQAMGQLCAEPTLRRLFARLRSQITLIGGVIAHLARVDVVDFALWTLRNMDYDCDYDHRDSQLCNDNKDLFQGIASVALFHARNEIIIESVCWLIHVIALARAVFKNKGCGLCLCETIITALRNHSQSAVVVISGCSAVMALAMNNDDHQAELCRLGARAMLQSLSVDSSEAMTVRDRAAASLSTMSTATDVMAALRNSDVVVAGQALDWIPMVLRVRGRGEQEVSLEKMMGVEGVLTELLRKEMASDEICAKVFLATRTLCHSQSSADRDGDIAGTGAGVFEEDDIVLKFVQAGMCTLVGTVIMLHMDKPMVVETGCETCIVLASDGRYADHFGTEGCEAMVCALGVHMANLGVARSANQAIANLARSPKTCDVLGETGACEAAVGTLTSHLPQWEVVEASSHAIATLSENSTNNVKLGYCGACAAIVSALITHWDIIPVVERCLSAIQNLSKDNIRNMESLRAVHINDAILTAWKTHINHVAVSEAACGAFLAVLPQNTDQKLKMIAMAANELLHVLSQSQSPESPFIRANVRSLRIIAHKSLPIGDVVNSLKLAAPTTASTSSSLTSILTSSFSSTCPDTSWDQIMLIIPIAVIGDESRTRQLAKCDGVARNMSKLLGQHFQTKTFCRHALKAINVLFGYGASLDIISTLGGDTGVCKSIVSILKYHCSVPEIIREVNWTILNLSSIPVLVSELGEAGVCRALVECLRLHLDDSATMESLCCAMHALDNDEKNMIHFMESDACPLLLTVLSKSPSSPTALEHVCQIIQQLSCIDHVTNELRKAETCYTLISALDIHRSMNVVTAAICRTIACIYQRTPDDPGLDPKALTTLVQFISVHVSVPDIAEAGCVVLHAIQMTTGKGLDADGLIVGQIISSALSTHVDVAVARQALLLMSVFQSPDELVFLMESGMCEAIVHAMSVLIREADVIESICVMIGNLAWNDVCVDCLGSVGACEALVAAMRMYISDARLVECMCAAMVRLSENNHVNRNRLLDAGADELLRSCFGYITSNRLHSSYIQLAFRNLMSVQYLVELLQYAASGVGTPNSDFVDGVLMTVTQGIVREYAQNQNIQLLQSVDIITTSILEIVKTSTRSASICKSAFASIAAISEIDVVRVALRKGHAFTVTAAALTSHIRHLNTVEEGCRAIRCLAIIRGKGRDNGNDIAGHHAGNNELLFGGSGGEDQINSACEAILLALTTYVTTCSVAEHGCLALADLIRCKGRVKLREGVYLDAIMMVLTTHASQPSVVAAAYTSLGHLCAVTAVNGSHVQVNAGACVRIASSLSLHESTPAVLEAVVWAIRNLSECSSVNRAKLGEEGVCGSLVTLLDANTCHIELGKEICHAIQVHALDKISLNRLFTAGVGRAVANFMTCHPSCSDIALIGCRTIRSLVLSNTPPPIALPLDVEEVFAAVSIAIDIHIHIPELAITCCHILVSLSNLDDIHHLDHHSSDDFSCRTKACRIILAILSHHISVTEVVETVFSAICTLVALPHCSEVFKEGRVWELIITAMNAHIRGSASLLGKGCGALLIVVDAMHMDVYDAVGVGGGDTLRTIALATGIDTYTDNDNGAGIGSGNDTIDMCATVRILAEEILRYTCLIHDTVMTIVSKDVSSGGEQSVVDVLSRIPAMVLREKDTHMSLGTAEGFASGFVQVLSRHRSSEPLVMKGLIALRYLCGDSDGSSVSVRNRKRCQRSAELLCEAGVCGVVVVLLEEHRNSSDVVKEVCHVMEVFTSFRHNGQCFDSTTSSYLINALSQHLTGNNNNNDMMTEWGCRAINALIIEDNSNNGNGYDHDFDHRRQLLTAGADGILRTYFLNKLNSTRLNHVIK
eukprot:gene2925-5741_t